MTVVIALIHAHVHPTMTMVHVNTVIIMGLVPHQDHSDIMIGVIHLGYIIVVIEITVTVLLIGMTTIVLGGTVLVTTVEGMATLMVSPRLGTIVRTAIPIQTITGKVKAATRVVIRDPIQIDIIMRAMDGTKGHNLIEKVRIGDSNKITLASSQN